MMKNAINWFEIPVTDFKRAKAFYENLFEAELETMHMEQFGCTMGFFPADLQQGVGGCIAQGEGYEPSENGSLIYLNGGDDLSAPLAKVENSGGSVILPKTSIGEHGYIAMFLDTEGNRVAFHSNR